VSTFEFGIFFLIVFKSLFFNNFYVKFLSRAFCLNYNFLYFFNFYCLCGNFVFYFNLNELIFRNIESIFGLILQMKLSDEHFFYSGFFNYFTNIASCVPLSIFCIKLDIVSFFFLKEDLESYRCIKYDEYLSQNWKISFN
jgi:hypothetical protein